MSTLENPQSWAPYANPKDCTQGFCTIYCPQWCYIIFPPPPPFEFESDDSSDTKFSPLVIAIIGILASAFLLVSYYTIVSKYCGDSLRRRSQNNPNEDFDESRSPSQRHEQWQVATTGLDEALIKSITVCKYGRGDGLVEGTDCSVCLNEFQDDESLRLLPKCSHAFHVTCIDTWLKSHSNCPLCRASIICANPPPVQLPPLVPESLPVHASSMENQLEHDILIPIEDSERGGEEVSFGNSGVASKSPFRAFSGLGDLQQRETTIEIGDNEIQPIRRSVSMDAASRDHISIGDVLEMSMEEGIQDKDQCFLGGAGSSKRGSGELGRGNNRSRTLHCVLSPPAMKRTSSNGRFIFGKHGRGRNAVIPEN